MGLVQESNATVSDMCVRFLCAKNLVVMLALRMLKHAGKVTI